MQAVRARLPLIVLLLLTLGGCALGPVAPSREELAAVEALAARGDNLAAAERYEAMAERAGGEVRDGLLLRAAEQYRRAAFPEKSLALLRRLEAARLTPAQQVDYALVAAELDLQAGNPRQALDRLDFRLDRLPPERQAEVLGVRGRALFAMGSALEATRLLLRRAALLQDPQARYANQQLIWQGLSQAREPLSAAGLPRDGKGRELAGWIELGAIGQSAWHSPDEFMSRLEDWARRYAGHPAEGRLLEEIRADFRRRFEYPARVALLLPLSGRYALQAEALRDGFMAARFQAVTVGRPPEIRLYDTGGTATGALDAFRRAREEGAQFVVGPLTKEGLAAVAALQGRTLPVLGLNYLEVRPGEEPRPHNLLYQFGLLPEDEARQAAERAIAEGHTRAVALAPANEWGERMLLAFKRRFEELGGTLLDGQFYPPDQTDYAVAITRVLNLDSSRLRHQALRNTLNLELQFEPRRRQDVEFVFIAAQERAAKLLRPQLKFHQALDLPVYATSHVYELDGRPDHDLDGIRFADMPWAIAPDAAGSALRETIRSLWPVRFSQAGRLYAMGFDAYRLIPLLANSVEPLARPVPGMTGLLSMDAAQRLHRDLYWAAFDNGRPRLLPPPEEDRSAATLHAAPRQP